jgi:hypothetical protein
MPRALATFFVLHCAKVVHGPHAHAAQAFGQEDDIPVLTLTLASAEALHA